MIWSNLESDWRSHWRWWWWRWWLRERCATIACFQYPIQTSRVDHHHHITTNRWFMRISTAKTVSRQQEILWRAAELNLVFCCNVKKKDEKNLLIAPLRYVGSHSHSSWSRLVRRPHFSQHSLRSRFRSVGSIRPIKLNRAFGYWSYQCVLSVRRRSK